MKRTDIQIRIDVDTSAYKIAVQNYIEANTRLTEAFADAAGYVAAIVKEIEEHQSKRVRYVQVVLAAALLLLTMLVGVAQ